MLKITENKWNAYFALSSSSTHIVSKPNVLLIDDCEIKMKKIVDWVSSIDKNKGKGFSWLIMKKLNLLKKN